MALCRTMWPLAGTELRKYYFLSLRIPHQVAPITQYNSLAIIKKSGYLGVRVHFGRNDAAGASLSRSKL